MKFPPSCPWVVMLVSSLTLVALAGVAVASPLTRNNLTEAQSVNLGYEIHTASTNVRNIPAPAKCMFVSADLLGSRLETTTSSPTSHSLSSLPVTCASIPSVFPWATVQPSTTA